MKEELLQIANLEKSTDRKNRGWFNQQLFMIYKISKTECNVIWEYLEEMDKARYN